MARNLDISFQSPDFLLFTFLSIVLLYLSEEIVSEPNPPTALIIYYKSSSL